MESKIKISLHTMEDIREFARKVTQTLSDVDIIKGSTIYDAKSIMAIFNMGSLEDVYVEIHSHDEREIMHFNTLMEEFKS